MLTKKLLVIVDMQNDFLLNGGELNLGHDTGELRIRVAKFTGSFDGDIIITKDTHEEDSCEFNPLPPHCLKGTRGHEVVSEIKDILGTKNVTTFEKGTFTGRAIVEHLARFAKDTLHSNKKPEIHFVGVCTHICVHDIVTSVVNECKEKHNFIPETIVHKDMVDDYDPEMAMVALRRMKTLYKTEIV